MATKISEDRNRFVKVAQQADVEVKNHLDKNNPRPLTEKGHGASSHF